MGILLLVKIVKNKRVIFKIVEFVVLIDVIYVNEDMILLIIDVKFVNKIAVFVLLGLN